MRKLESADRVEAGNHVGGEVGGEGELEEDGEDGGGEERGSDGRPGIGQNGAIAEGGFRGRE